jgi:hypothetical protein
MLGLTNQHRMLASHVLKQKKNHRSRQRHHGDLAGDIVAKTLCYCNKTNLAGDITGELAGAKKNCAIVAKLDFTGDIVATIFCYCWSCHTLQLLFLLSLKNTHGGNSTHKHTQNN